MMEFNERLKLERKRLGLSQEKFAALGGVTRDTQMNYENGSRKPDSAYLTAMAVAGIDVLFLLTGESSNAPLTKDESDLLEGFRSLDIRGKAGVLGMIFGLTSGSESSSGARTPAMNIKGNVGHQIHGDVFGTIKGVVMGNKIVKKK
ncbi:transcriptional regulator [Herbaspirillum sp. VT-16-41]|nr:transcriptional regulator [Herbaspirillum sp. VT-16-41]